MAGAISPIRARSPDRQPYGWSWDLKRIVLEATCRAVGISNPINLVIGFGLDQITVDVVFR